MTEDKPKITLFHGTTEYHRSSIENGLKENSCLTDDIDLTWYYAEVVSEEDYSDLIVLEFVANLDDLVIDSPALSEPITIGKAADRQKELAKENDRSFEENL